MKYYVLCFVLVVVACGQQKKYHDEQQPMTIGPGKQENTISAYQEALNAAFRDPETSPLPDRYRKNFEGLDFFAPDTNYMVRAKLERTPGATPFLMKTTTNRKTTEVVYGIAHFRLNGKAHQLEIYQSTEPAEGEAEDYLFLPFLDATNGEETYGGGRYIDLPIPDGDTIVIDFNKAYNPYCVYNKKYSCPLVPRQNYLKTRVVAGVKDFVKK